MQEAFDTGRLHGSGSLQALADPAGFTAHLRPTRQTDWVVYATPPFVGPQQVLEYVGRDTHRVAISNQRLLDMDDGHVRVRDTDDRAAPDLAQFIDDTTLRLRSMSEASSLFAEDGQDLLYTPVQGNTSKFLDLFSGMGNVALTPSEGPNVTIE